MTPDTLLAISDREDAKLVFDTRYTTQMAGKNCSFHGARSGHWFMNLSWEHLEKASPLAMLLAKVDNTRSRKYYALPCVRE